MKTISIFIALLFITYNSLAYDKANYVLIEENENVMQDLADLENVVLDYYDKTVKGLKKGNPLYVFTPSLSSEFMFNVINPKNCTVIYTNFSVDLVDKNLCERDTMGKVSNLDEILKRNKSKEWINSNFTYVYKNSLYEFQTIMFTTNELLFMFGIFDKKYNKKGN